MRKSRASIPKARTLISVRSLLQPISKQSTKPTVPRTSFGSGSAFLVPYREYERCCTSTTSAQRHSPLRQPSFTFRLALPCVTFRDASLKLTSSAPSLRYRAAGGRLAHERARIIQREQPEIHLHLHPSRNLGTMGCIGPLPTSPVLISTSVQTFPYARATPARLFLT
ncbi:hypothetical protein ALC53_06388 [Atta colombica]|uniref:Uncharacterized protein n=1 Tax=Atta colombica TaxID=520822 RepID=A0A195BG14_9HYME|nr:hypothetical protein ALC53_06388 [Atta colombica]